MEQVKSFKMALNENLKTNNGFNGWCTCLGIEHNEEINESYSIGHNDFIPSICKVDSYIKLKALAAILDIKLKCNWTDVKKLVLKNKGRIFVYIYPDGSGYIYSLPPVYLPNVVYFIGRSTDSTFDFILNEKLISINIKSGDEYKGIGPMDIAQALENKVMPYGFDSAELHVGNGKVLTSLDSDALVLFENYLNKKGDSLWKEK